MDCGTLGRLNFFFYENAFNVNHQKNRASIRTQIERLGARCRMCFGSVWRCYLTLGVQIPIARNQCPFKRRSRHEAVSSSKLFFLAALGGGLCLYLI